VALVVHAQLQVSFVKETYKRDDILQKELVALVVHAQLQVSFVKETYKRDDILQK